MGLWQRRIFPVLLDRVMQNRRLTELRRRIAGEARGCVLEIGIGSGLNLPFYGRSVEHLTGIDPSPELLARAAERARWVGFPVRLLTGSAEELPLADRSVDCVVSSWTLCSIPDVRRALAEIVRVLRPGGAFLFVEHGLAPDPRVACAQRWLTPFWRRIAGGCHLDRPVPELLAESGLQLQEVESGYLLPGPRLFTYHWTGRAVPAQEAGSGRAGGGNARGVHPDAASDSRSHADGLRARR